MGGQEKRGRGGDAGRAGVDPSSQRFLTKWELKEDAGH